jgi:hypothetical protein
VSVSPPFFAVRSFVADRYTRVKDSRKGLAIMKKTAFLVLLLVAVISGCSALSNSASFYRDHPPSQHTNWHEYTE